MLIIENIFIFDFVWNKLVFIHGGSDREKKSNFNFEAKNLMRLGKNIVREKFRVYLTFVSQSHSVQW